MTEANPRAKIQDSQIPRGSSLWKDSIRRLRRRKFVVVCFWIFMLYVLTAVYVHCAEFVSWKWDVRLWPVNWEQTVGESYEAPSGANPFGTDFMGRSVLRKTFYGAKVSLTVAFFASVISMIIGIPMGAMAGYFRGVVDEIIVWLYSTLSSVPYILLILAFALVLKNKTVFGFGLGGSSAVYLAIGLTSWVGICRLIRGEIIKHKEREYVLAAKSYGCGNGRIIFKHLLPNVFHIVIITFSLSFVTFIHVEVILSFLGLGETNKPSWGAMIDTARQELPRGHWWEMTAATVAIFFISLSLNIFGDALRDSLDPKLRTD